MAVRNAWSFICLLHLQSMHCRVCTLCIALRHSLVLSTTEYEPIQSFISQAGESASRTLFALGRRS